MYKKNDKKSIDIEEEFSEVDQFLVGMGNTIRDMKQQSIDIQKEFQDLEKYLLDMGKEDRFCIIYNTDMKWQIMYMINQLTIIIQHSRDLLKEYKKII